MLSLFTSPRSAVVGLILTAFLGAAQGQSFEACRAPVLNVMFSNGVNTDRNTARGLTEVTYEKLSTRHSSSPIRVAATQLFHDTHGVVDFAEVYLQKVEEAALAGRVTRPEALMAFMAALSGNSAGALGVAELDDALDAAKRELATASFVKVAQENVSSDVDRDVAAVGEVLDSGDYALIVAHSQGTLFANQVMRRLYAERPHSVVNDKVFLVSAGVAASSVVGRDGVASLSNYVTAHSDVAINGLRIAASLARMSAPAFPNATVTVGREDGLDSLHHGYETTYLNERHETGQKLFALVDAAHAAFAAATTGAPQPEEAYVLRVPLAFNVSVVEDFDEGPVVELALSGPLGSHGTARLRYEGNPFGAVYEVTVLCSLRSTLTETPTPITAGVAIETDVIASRAGPATVRLSGGRVVSLPASSVAISAMTLNSERWLTVAAQVGMHRSTAPDGFSVQYE
jgi:hypothetical protein